MAEAGTTCLTSIGYRAGDQIRVTRNDYRLGLLNGTPANVTSVDPNYRTLTLVTDEQQQVIVDVSWAGQHLDHGYAMTCHKAQGATGDTALLYGAGALTREAGYVALPRGRTENHAYLPDRVDDLAGVESRTTSTSAPHTSPYDAPGHSQAANSPDPSRCAGSRATPTTSIRAALKGSPDDRTVLLDPVETAAALGFGRRKLYQLLQAGELESIHIGTCRRIPTIALDALIDRLRGSASDAAAS